MSLPVDPDHLTPLIQGLSELLKNLGIHLHDQIRSALSDISEHSTFDPMLSGRPRGKVWTWGEATQELINYSRRTAGLGGRSPKN